MKSIVTQSRVIIAVLALMFFSGVSSVSYGVICALRECTGVGACGALDSSFCYQVAIPTTPPAMVCLGSCRRCVGGAGGAYRKCVSALNLTCNDTAGGAACGGLLEKSRCGSFLGWCDGSCPFPAGSTGLACDITNCL
jgi:hypothetical protein